MSALINLSLAPAVICLLYVYVRDKYEKEPVGLLVAAVSGGVAAAFLVLFCGSFLKFFEPKKSLLLKNIYTVFVSSAGIEELMKFILLVLIPWRSKNFNEHFDGIVYGAFVALGFAAVENVIYVLSPTLGGFNTAIKRAVYSVPGHGLFGVSMGYYYAFAKFSTQKRKKYLFLSFFVPWLLHSAYNGILIFLSDFYLAVFIPYLIFLWENGFKKMNIHINKSPFKND